MSPNKTEDNNDHHQQGVIVLIDYLYQFHIYALKSAACDIFKHQNC